MSVIGASKKHPINAIAEYVHETVPYMTDEQQFHKDDWWQLPTESLSNRKGDCDDTAILVGSMLASIGYETRLVVGSISQGYHMWVETQDSGDQWWLIETTTGEVYKLDSRQELGYEADYYITYKGGCAYMHSSTMSNFPSY